MACLQKTNPEVPSSSPELKRKQAMNPVRSTRLDHLTSRTEDGKLTSIILSEIRSPTCLPGKVSTQVTTQSPENQPVELLGLRIAQSRPKNKRLCSQFCGMVASASPVLEVVFRRYEICRILMLLEKPWAPPTNQRFLCRAQYNGLKP